MASKPSTMSNLVRLARSHSALMAGLLYLYQETEGLSDEALAQYLQCDMDALPRLALCRRPRPAPQFRQDIEQIARFTGAKPFKLMRLIRAAESRQAFRATATTATLLAARDREELDEPSRLDPGDGDDEH